MRLRRTISVCDYHHGQATRLVVGGLPPLRGRTMAEKQAHLLRDHGSACAALLREPRGHRNLLGAVLTEPVSEGAAAGVLFLSPHGTFDMCGDSTISAATYLVEAGAVAPAAPEVSFVLDTVAGPVPVRVAVQGGEVESVTFRNVPSFRVGGGPVALSAFPGVSVDLAFGGLLYAMVPAQTLGVSLTGDLGAVAQRAFRLLAAARDEVDVRHPATGAPLEVALATVHEELPGTTRRIRVANCYAPDTLGRTPSGTGSAARAALCHAAGELAVGDALDVESILGGVFRATVAEETEVGGTPAVAVDISARSYALGWGQVVFDERDPFPEGFVL